MTGFLSKKQYAEMADRKRAIRQPPYGIAFQIKVRSSSHLHFLTINHESNSYSEDTPFLLMRAYPCESEKVKMDKICIFYGYKRKRKNCRSFPKLS